MRFQKRGYKKENVTYKSCCDMLLLSNGYKIITTKRGQQKGISNNKNIPLRAKLPLRAKRQHLKAINPFNNHKMVKSIRQLKANRKAFIPLSVVRHNSNIKQVVYSNPKVIKPLFFIGLVLPDFKISWVILGLYSVVKYPIKLKVLCRHKISDLKHKFYLLLMKGGLY